MAGSNSNRVGDRLRHRANTGMEKEVKKAILGSLALALLFIGISTVLPAETRPQTSFAGSGASDKYDGDCTGTETEGRCADKCPPGSYSIGMDDKTGAAICKLEPTGCPYGDSIPLGPDCDKHAPANQPPVEPAKPNQCGGK